MKIILSRKGFDASAGGCPSPILPDGRLCSLPIPRRGERSAQEIRFGDGSLGELIEALSGGRLKRTASVHLDPDLRRESLPRPRGWRPCFGQDGSAQGHLRKQGVGAGDLFLFYGWYRETENRDGRLVFRRGAPHMHVLYGWMQIGERYALRDAGTRVPAWARAHPHVAHEKAYASDNTLYVARPRLALSGLRRAIPGGGAFERFAPRLRLTEEGRTRSVWRLARWFHPGRGRPPLSHHDNPSRWTRVRKGVRLRTVGRGQEFVLDVDHYPAALIWARNLIAGAR